MPPIRKASGLGTSGPKRQSSSEMGRRIQGEWDTRNPATGGIYHRSIDIDGAMDIRHPMELRPSTRLKYIT
eukprot:scaffold220963_cov30-Tisochrysis_lutea.AAC.4